jgi:hypothetical protein
MNREAAIEIKRSALEAVEALSHTLYAAKDAYSAKEMSELHREVGQLIGRIQIGVLEPIFKHFPDLEDLK